MQFTAQQIAAIVGGTVHGNEHASVSSFGKIEEATQGQLCFLANPKYQEFIYTTQASVALVSSTLQLTQEVVPTLVKVDNPYQAFALLLQQYDKLTNPVFQNLGVENHSYIHPTAQVASDAYIGAFAYIGAGACIGAGAKIFPHCYIGANAVVGAGSILHPSVIIYHHCIVGSNCILHAGVVVGSDGFGFAPSDAQNTKVPQIGNVIIEDDVEIGANTCIDRATMGSTILRRGVKLDNMVQIAHNVELGEHTMAAGLSAVAGSTKVGSHVIIGAQAGVVGHISIARGAKINGQSGVSKSISQEGMAVTGSPASEYKQMMKAQAIMRNLPQLQAQLNALQKEVEELKKNK